MKTMAAASTIIIAREDYSIPGSSEGEANPPEQLERRFFDLLKSQPPDVVVLDLTKTTGAGLQTIRTLRERSRVPILVVHAADDPLAEDYRVCGAASCVTAPIDFVRLNGAIQRIIDLSGPAKSAPAGGASAARSSGTLMIAGIRFDPDQNALSGKDGSKATLTTLENDILSFLAARPRIVCTRSELAQTLYSDYPPSTERAIDVIVKRLRKKLDAVDETRGRNLIKTEFRRGYILAADVSPAVSA
jgi:DNA-binding response OmpR family regulator